MSLVNCSFWGPIDRCVWMRGEAGQFTASACNFVHWDNAGNNSPAIQLDAGKGIVQGCTFGQGDLHVEVAEKVASAILTANQAEGGFRVENRAGRRTQTGLNEADPVEWTPEALSHYRVDIGKAGDARYVRTWHGCENPDRPYRWSRPDSKLVLPVVSGKEYEITLEFAANPHALSEDAGIYLDGKKLAPFNKAPALTAKLPPVSSDRVALEIRCRGWVPEKVMPGSKDARELGIQVYGVTMRAMDASAKVFDANTGEYLE